MQVRAVESGNIPPDSTPNGQQLLILPDPDEPACAMQARPYCAAEYDTVIRPHRVRDHVSFRHEQSLLPLRTS